MLMLAKLTHLAVMLFIVWRKWIIWGVRMWSFGIIFSSGGKIGHIFGNTIFKRTLFENLVEPNTSMLLTDELLSVVARWLLLNPPRWRAACRAVAVRRSCLQLDSSTASRFDRAASPRYGRPDRALLRSLHLPPTCWRFKAGRSRTERKQGLVQCWRSGISASCWFPLRLFGTGGVWFLMSATSS